MSESDETTMDDSAVFELVAQGQNSLVFEAVAEIEEVSESIRELDNITSMTDNCFVGSHFSS